MCNTVAYERSLLEEVTCEHFATLVQPGTFESKVSLVKAHKLKAFLEAEKYNLKWANLCDELCLQAMLRCHAFQERCGLAPASAWQQLALFCW